MADRSEALSLHQGKVDAEYIRSIIASKSNQNINHLQALQIIREYFCRTIIMRGVCPQSCELCRDEIADLFRLEKAEKPGALLTWLAKDHAARWIEKLIQREKFHALESSRPSKSEQEAYDDLFPDRKPEENLFILLGMEYER